MKLLKELCLAAAIPGREKAVIDIMKRELSKTTDKVTIDQMGNVIGVKKCGIRNAPKVMIAGHMDEIGFIVSHIDKNGFIRFAPRGGHVPKVLYSQRVTVCGKKQITGIVEGASAFLAADPADRKKSGDLKDFFIDTGLSASVLKKQVAVGDIIVMEGAYVTQGNNIITKALDNRVGCYIVLETMKQLKKHKVDVYAIGTSQEEVGIRGAHAAAKDIQPDMGIALDVTAAFDTPGVEPHNVVTKLNEGTAIKINDQSSISNHGIVEFLKKTAKKNKIKYQLEVLPFGGTDARGIQFFGAGPVCTISVPTRYVHSPHEIASKNDIQASIKLLTKFLETCETCQPEF